MRVPERAVPAQDPAESVVEDPHPPPRAGDDDAPVGPAVRAPQDAVAPGADGPGRSRRGDRGREIASGQSRSGDRVPAIASGRASLSPRRASPVVAVPRRWPRCGTHRLPSLADASWRGALLSVSVVRRTRASGTLRPLVAQSSAAGRRPRPCRGRDGRVLRTSPLSGPARVPGRLT